MARDSSMEEMVTESCRVAIRDCIIDLMKNRVESTAGFGMLEALGDIVARYDDHSNPSKDYRIGVKYGTHNYAVRVDFELFGRKSTVEVTWRELVA